MTGGARDKGRLPRHAGLPDTDGARRACWRDGPGLGEQWQWPYRVLAGVGDAVVTTDLGGGVLFLNAAAEALSGWRSQEARTRRLGEVCRMVDEKRRLPLDCPAVQALRQGRSVELAEDAVLVAKDGTSTPVEGNVSLLRDERGRVCGAVLMLRNVSARRQAERSWRKSERELADFFENGALGLHCVGPEGTILRVNQAELDLLGYAREEYVGRSIAEFHVDPAAAGDILRRLASGETLRNHEARMRCKDGSVKHVLIDSSVLREDGRFVHTRCFTRDVTEQKRAERRLIAQHEVTLALAGSATLQEAAPRVLGAVCAQLDWQLGALWHVERFEQVLRCSQVWRRSGDRTRRFETACRRRTFRPGEGLPGRVWRSAEAVWVPDVAHEGNFPRAAVAAGVGLRGAFAFPVVLHGTVLGVVEFFSHAIEQPDADLLQMMSAVGSQLGQFIERKRAEEALRDSEQRLRLLAETLPSIVWTAEPDGTISYANWRWFEYCGLSPEHDERGWSERVLHPEDRGRCVAAWSRALRQGSEYEIEVRNRRHDGVYRWFVTRAVPLRDAAGRVVQWFGTTTDIDDRKRAEQTSRFLAEAGMSLAQVSDYESTLQRIAALAVPAFADWCAVDIRDADGSVRRLAVTHAEPDKVRLAHELFRRYPPRPDDAYGVMKVLRTGAPEWAATISEALLAEAARDEEHMRIIRRLGLKSFICVPLRSGGEILGALSFVTAESGRAYDVADLAAAEDLARRSGIAIENARLMSALKDSDRRKDEFLAMLAHELRNPLAPIRNAAQIIRGRAASEPELQWAAGVIDRQVDQMTRLVDDLLDVSRITRGKIEPRKERVELAAVVNSAVESSRPFIEQRRHELCVSLPPEPIVLEADPTRIEQVLLNLLNNAAKYTEDGGRIRLAVERQGGEALIRVKDNGIGIAREMLPEVFTLFTQADRSLERRQSGLGIGLTLVQRLVALHGGSVQACSEGLGQGSEFLVRLPLARRPAAAPPRPAAEADEERSASSGTRRILVVDDRREAADSLAVLLRRLGHEVHTAYDGPAAVQAAKTLRPDVVLLDIGLPKLNGYEVARRIRGQPGGERALLIALTGWGQDEDRRHSQQAGFDHHLTKPVAFADLRRLLTHTPVAARPRA